MEVLKSGISITINLAKRINAIYNKGDFNEYFKCKEFKPRLWRQSYI